MSDYDKAKLIAEGKPLPEEPEDKVRMTRAMLNQAMPNSRGHLITDSLLDKLNKILEDEHIAHSFRDNYLTLIHVLDNGAFGIKDYTNGIKYVTNKLMGDSHVVAYSKTFPERFQRLVDKGSTNQQLSMHAGAYHRGKLVTLLLEQAMVPSWIVNQDLYQKALNAQAELMLYARSEKVRSDAAAHLMSHLKLPETAKLQLDVTAKEDTSIQQLREVTMKLVTQQRAMLQAGAMTIKEIAEQKIIVDDIPTVDEMVAEQ
jgi:hypothetical protein